MKQKKLKIYELILQLNISNTKEEIDNFVDSYKSVITKAAPISTVVSYGSQQLTLKKREKTLLQLKLKFIANQNVLTDLRELLKFDERVSRSLILAS